jgi:colanic acid/amylovoran biosynthesis protein
MHNILIINQPMGNRGDESAHRALVRNLNEALPYTHITVLTFADYANAEQEFIVNNPLNEYVNFLFPHNLAASTVAQWSLKLGLQRIALHVHPILRKLIPYYQEADIVLCAPGGICMGGFQDWLHLFMLYVAKICKKPLVYYSRSFGPFPTRTWMNRRFKHLSETILRYFTFLSIRDKKTMQLADSMNIHYTPAIDTAFLEQPQVSVPQELQLQGKKYVVFVPNSLTWHYAFRQCSQKKIESFYISIIGLLRQKYPDCDIVMLPQLCSIGAKGDYTYFLKLQSLCIPIDRSHIQVIPDIYGSDIQQSIIRKAELVVGARYHSIVFAINNGRPFIALNYEHKIAGVLELLQLSCRKVDIPPIVFLEPEDDTQNILYQLEHMLFIDGIDNKTIYQQKAHNIAQQCFDTMIQKIQE